MHTLGVTVELAAHHLGRDFEELKDGRELVELHEQHALTPSQMRPGTGNIPVVSQIAIIDDVKRGLGPTAIGEAYRPSGDSGRSVAWPLATGSIVHAQTVRTRSPLVMDFFEEVLVPVSPIS